MIDTNTDGLDRILILDGGMGTMIQRYSLGEQDYRGEIFAGVKAGLRGDNECLNLTRPDIIEAIHQAYIDAGADIIETNSFNANAVSQAEYGLSDRAPDMALAAGRIARKVADRAGRRVLVAGSLGPSGKSLTLASDLNRPAYRQYSFEQMRDAFAAQIRALIDGGVDLILIETCFDALNAKAAIRALEDVSRGFPLMISATVSDRSGRTLTGQTLEAFYTAVRHANPFSFGINCALGPVDMLPLVEEISRFATCRVSCHPNAGIPDETGSYTMTPKAFSDAVARMAGEGLLNIAGGCCGTGPEHIRALAEAIRNIPARVVPQPSKRLSVSGLETFTIDRSSNFTNIGERTNVAGSRKFAKIIAAGDYDGGLKIAASQIEGGASIIDVNMDDAMLDSAAEMQNFLRCAANDPAVSRAAVMIDSSHWETLLAGLQNVQGKPIVNSISLKDGEEEFLRRAAEIRDMGAAMVVMAFDERGQATDFARKTEISQRAYKLLTGIGIQPSDIIFDVNVLTVGTGMREHERYAVDFIEAVRWIKRNLPGALTSGGISNLSFAFRGNNAVREAMHSAFLYHAIAAGLDMAIVNPTMLQVYDSIEPELLRCVEDVIFARDPQATSRLVTKAQALLSSAAADASNPAPLPSAAPASNPDPLSRLSEALVKGASETLADDLMEALTRLGSPTAVIEGPLMAGMEKVGKLFGDGKMFLPQVIKSAKVMKDAVAVLQPYIDGSSAQAASVRKKAVIATVKGDVHDIGKNITAIVLQCNGFEVHDLGVMVPEEDIISSAESLGADIIGVSGLITPSLYRMEELCRKMTAEGFTTPLFVGGAAASAKHTALKLRPLYRNVHYASDASQTAVKAVRCVTDPVAFAAAEDAEYDKFAGISAGPLTACPCCASRSTVHSLGAESPRPPAQQAALLHLSLGDVSPKLPAQQAALLYLSLGDVSPKPPATIKSFDSTFTDTESIAMVTGSIPSTSESAPAVAEPVSAVTEPVEVPAGTMKDIPFRKLTVAEIMDFFDWRMFQVVCGTAKAGDGLKAEMRSCAQALLDTVKYDIRVAVRFFDCFTEDDTIISADGLLRIPLPRHGAGESLCDFFPGKESAKLSQCGIFAASVFDGSENDLLHHAVRVSLAEAASGWMNHEIGEGLAGGLKIIMPGIGYSCCPDHSLKADVLALLPTELGIRLTESYAMLPESSVCGLVIAHPRAHYTDLRSLDSSELSDYARRRGISLTSARQLLGYLLA